MVQQTIENCEPRQSAGVYVKNISSLRAEIQPGKMYFLDMAAG
ncbi:MAG: hypothetical protein ACOX2P_00365 [Bacillota bacterium]